MGRDTLICDDCIYKRNEHKRVLYWKEQIKLAENLIDKLVDLIEGSAYSHYSTEYIAREAQNEVCLWQAQKISLKTGVLKKD